MLAEQLSVGLIYGHLIGSCFRHIYSDGKAIFINSFSQVHSSAPSIDRKIRVSRFDNFHAVSCLNACNVSVSGCVSCHISVSSQGCISGKHTVFCFNDCRRIHICLSDIQVIKQNRTVRIQINNIDSFLEEYSLIHICPAIFCSRRFHRCGQIAQIHCIIILIDIDDGIFGSRISQIKSIHTVFRYNRCKAKSSSVCYRNLIQPFHIIHTALTLCAQSGFCALELIELALLGLICFAELDICFVWSFISKINTVRICSADIVYTLNCNCMCACCQSQISTVHSAHAPVQRCRQNHLLRLFSVHQQILDRRIRSILLRISCIASIRSCINQIKLIISVCRNIHLDLYCGRSAIKITCLLAAGACIGSICACNCRIAQKRTVFSLIHLLPCCTQKTRCLIFTCLGNGQAVCTHFKHIRYRDHNIAVHNLHRAFFDHSGLFCLSMETGVVRCLQLHMHHIRVFKRLCAGNVFQNNIAGSVYASEYYIGASLIVVQGSNSIIIILRCIGCGYREVLSGHIAIPFVQPPCAVSFVISRRKSVQIVGQMPERQTSGHIVLFKQSDPADQISGRRTLCICSVFIDNNLSRCDIHTIFFRIFRSEIFLLQPPVMIVFIAEIVKLPRAQIMPGDYIRHTVVLNTEFYVFFHYPVVITGKIQTGKTGFGRYTVLFIDIYNHIVHVFPEPEKAVPSGRNFPCLRIFIGTADPVRIRLVVQNVYHLVLDSFGDTFFRLHLQNIQILVRGTELIEPERIVIRHIDLKILAARIQKCLRHIQHISVGMLHSVGRFLHCRMGLQRCHRIRAGYPLGAQTVQPSGCAVL